VSALSFFFTLFPHVQNTGFLLHYRDTSISLAAHLPFIARAVLHPVSRVQLQAKRRAAQVAFFQTPPLCSLDRISSRSMLAFIHLLICQYFLCTRQLSRTSCCALQFITWIIPASPLVSNPFVSSDPSKHLHRYPRIHPTPGT